MLPIKFSDFVRNFLGRQLYPYQEQIAEAILHSVRNDLGITFTVMLARQMGKNELSAMLQAYLLYTHEKGCIVKAAPTFKPQILNSRARLLEMLQAPELSKHSWKSFGHIIGLASSRLAATFHQGPRVMLFSAEPESNIVGATASLLLEVDEAQAVSIKKYDTDLRPMSATTHATTVLYGTAWTDNSLLAIQRAHNLELERQDGIKRHFEYDWTHLASINPLYRSFVEEEIARLGKDDITIRTQYLLKPISDAGRLFTDMHHLLLRGTHSWQHEPDEGEEVYYVAGIDVGGEERTNPDPTASLCFVPTKRDSTVVTIARVSPNSDGQTALWVVHQQWWTGKPYIEQYHAICALAERWSLQKIVIDKTGLGEMLASMLTDKLGPQTVTPFHFTRESKSSLTYSMIARINTARLKLYTHESAPRHVAEECMRQLRAARYSIPREGLIGMYVDPTEGHDDFLISLALCGETLSTYVPPRPYCPTLIIPPVWHDERDWRQIILEKIRNDPYFW